MNDEAETRQSRPETGRYTHTRQPVLAPNAINPAKKYILNWTACLQETTHSNSQPGLPVWQIIMATTRRLGHLNPLPRKITCSNRLPNHSRPMDNYQSLSQRYRLRNSYQPMINTPMKQPHRNSTAVRNPAQTGPTIQHQRLNIHYGVLRGSLQIPTTLLATKTMMILIYQYMLMTSPLMTTVTLHLQQSRYP